MKLNKQDLVSYFGEDYGSNACEAVADTVRSADARAVAGFARVMARWITIDHGDRLYARKQMSPRKSESVNAIQLT